MPRSLHTDLVRLGLNLDDLKGESTQEQKKIIRRQWLKLSVEFHPDKNPSLNAGEIFSRIRDAYTALKDGIAAYNPANNLSGQEVSPQAVDKYYVSENITIPLTAFDLILQENIENTYEALIREFSQLETEGQRQAFGLYYGPFLNLGHSLLKLQAQLHMKRPNYLSDQDNQSLIARITREWRELILRLFGDEYLDDFQYRQALASGDLYPILATRKLLSPIKWMIAILNSISLLLWTSTSYAFQLLVDNVIKTFSNCYHNIKQGNFYVTDAALALAGMATMYGVIYLPLYIAPSLIFVGLAPILSKIAEIIANPVNQIVRPLAAYLNISAVKLTAILSMASLLATYSLLGIVSGMNVGAVLGSLFAPLCLYSLYANIKLVINIYRESPAVGTFLGIITGVNWLIASPFVLPAANADLLTDVLPTFLLLTGNCITLHHLNQKIETSKFGRSEIIEVLPLPAEPIPEPIRQATLLATKKAAQSHRFFNTPNDADFILQNDRTYWQQSCSFFGGGEKTKNPPKTFERTVGLLSYRP